MNRAVYSPTALAALHVKLREISRRAPAKFDAIQVLADAVLEGLGPEDAEPYQWKCDEPNRTKKGGK